MGLSALSTETGLLLPTHVCVLWQEGHCSGPSGPSATVSADMLAACGGNTWNSADTIIKFDYTKLVFQILALDKRLFDLNFK